jgi:alpha-tubulin suppressor-like RCC1 family protein
VSSLIPCVSYTSSPLRTVGGSGVWAWGSGAGYKLGVGDQKDRYDPVLVPRLKEKTILQVSAAAWHSMVIVLYPPMMGGGVYSSLSPFLSRAPS